MASKNFYMLPDSQLALASANFATLISATPTTYGITAAQATTYATLNTAYQAALVLATGESTKTKVTVGNKNIARKNLRANAIQLAAFIRNTPTVTNPQLQTLGLLPRTIPMPIPAPGAAPVVQIVSVSGNSVNIRLRNGTGSGRGKPPGVKSATVFSYVGAVAPTDITLWQYQGVMTKVTATVVFPDTVAGGSRVWLTAIWSNNRGQSGPAADPVSTNIAGGGVGAMAEAA
jgi:hypothetical protein